MGDRAKEISAGFRGDNGGENELLNLLKRMGYGVKEAASKAKELLSDAGRDLGTESAIRRKAAAGETLTPEERDYMQKYMADDPGVRTQEPRQTTKSSNPDEASEDRFDQGIQEPQSGTDRFSGLSSSSQDRSTGGSDPYSNNNPNGRSEAPGPGVSFGPGPRDGEQRGRTALTQETPDEDAPQGRTVLTRAAEESGEEQFSEFYRSEDVIFSFSPDKRNIQDDRVKVVQQTLEEQGFTVGPDGIDGWYGKDTSSAVKQFQAENGLEPTGNLDKATADALGLSW
jgi:hypothetical protein